jgi:hypothetical protein
MRRVSAGFSTILAVKPAIVSGDAVFLETFWKSINQTNINTRCAAMRVRRQRMNRVNFSPGGIGFGGLLAVLFIGLKLGGVINWSWLWVLSPLWIPAVAVIFILGIAFLVATATKK